MLRRASFPSIFADYHIFTKVDVTSSAHKYDGYKIFIVNFYCASLARGHEIIVICDFCVMRAEDVDNNKYI